MCRHFALVKNKETGLALPHTDIRDKTVKSLKSRTLVLSSALDVTEASVGKSEFLNAVNYSIPVFDKTAVRTAVYTQ